MNWFDCTPIKIRECDITKMEMIKSLDEIYSLGVRNDKFTIILPIDQGVEHGPIKTFIDSNNPSMYNAEKVGEFIVKLCEEELITAAALPKKLAYSVMGELSYHAKTNKRLQMFRHWANSRIIVKGNHNNSLNDSIETTRFVDEEDLKTFLNLGWTIYPGSLDQKRQIEEFVDIKRKAEITILWSYQRGGDVGKWVQKSEAETAHSLYIAAQLMPDMIKVKLPDVLSEKHDYGQSKLVDAASGIPVIFSGGPQKRTKDVLDDVNRVKEYGGKGMIIGRNIFRRPINEAVDLLKLIHEEFKK